MAPIDEVIKRLQEEYKKWKPPEVTELARKKKDPFQVLISCILSLRTKDEVTKEASKKLFERHQPLRRCLG